MVGNSLNFLNLFSYSNLWIAVEAGVITFAILYFIFTLIVVRQVYLMTEELITEVSPLLRAFAILYAGFSLGIVVLLIGLFLG